MSDAGLKKVFLNFDGIVAESICCQMLCRHSLASLFEAVSTILGEAIVVSHLLSKGTHEVIGVEGRVTKDRQKTYVTSRSRKQRNCYTKTINVKRSTDFADDAEMLLAFSILLPSLMSFSDVLL